MGTTHRRHAVARARRGLLVGLFAIAGLVWAAAPAEAHTDMAESTPADGATVREPLETITFSFTQPVTPFEDGFRLTAFDGSQLPIESIEQPDPRTVVVRPVEPIRWVVSATWAIVSGDTHPVTGSIQVVVALPEPAPTTTVAAAAGPAPAGPSPGAGEGTPEGPEAAAPPASIPVAEQQRLLDQMDTDSEMSGATTLNGAIRWVGYLATALTIGGIAVAAFARRPDQERVWRATRPVVVLAVGFLMAASVLVVGGQLAALTGETGDVFAVGRWGDVLSGSFMIGVVLRVAGAVALAVAVAPRRAPGRAAAATGAVLVLVSYPFLGHGSDVGSPWVAGPSTVVHVAAISVWMGGLVAVVTVLMRLRGIRAGELVGRFSRLAGIALLAAVAAGLALTVAELATPAELWETSYGRRLLVKIALVTGVVALGGLHRFVTVPRLANGAGSSSTMAFLRVAWAEVTLFGAVLVATAWLVAGAT